MKNLNRRKIRLVLTISICMLFFAVMFSSAMGQLFSNLNDSTNEKEQNEIEPNVQGLNPLQIINFRILNRDWDYWSNKPNICSIGNGNVGIGTNNPTEKLHVSDGRILASYGYGIRFPQLNQYSAIWTVNDELIISNQGNGNICLSTLAPGKGIGIQTSSPETVLHIADDTPIIRFEERDQNNKMWNIGGFNSGIVISEPGIGDRVFIQQGGNVGIGTKTPAYKLDVEGYIQAYGFYTGDIIFQKNGQQLWRMFEDENGLYLQNLETEKVYRFVLEDIDEIVTLNNRIIDLEARIAELEALIK